MALEVALIDVRPGVEDDFVTAYRQGRALIAQAPGCLHVRMTHGVETPTRFVLLVQWESVAAHDAFRASPEFPKWRGLVGPWFAGPPHVEHFEDVDEPLSLT